jgi:hypothetical protein
VTLVVLLVVAAAAAWYLQARQRRNGAGSSAAAQARRLRSPLVRLADLSGISTQRGRQAQQWAQGASGEQATAVLLEVLVRQGWTALHDRALPSGKANVDHLVISPGGLVFVVDSKKWSARYRVRVVRGRLLHGTVDVTARLGGLHHEARTVARVLGTPVLPVVAMHGAPVEGGELLLDGIRILPASRVPAVLRTIARRRSATGPHPGPRAAVLLPPHGRN